MKRLILTFILLIPVVFFAQERKIKYIGGGISIYGNTDADALEISISPEVGIYVSKHVSIGIVLTHSSYTYKEPSESFQTSSLNSMSAYCRYYFSDMSPFNFFADFSAACATTDSLYQKILNLNRNKNGVEIGIKPGFSFALTDNIKLISRIGFLGYRKDYMNKSSVIGFGANLNDLSFGIIWSL
ncbi:MAG: hypothetical protein LBV41_00330 [Cytophagaceae bacterium]|jgi:hypothetical protein|nr:hypothetical protein [Cytophagaceae bacterium]